MKCEHCETEMVCPECSFESVFSAKLSRDLREASQMMEAREARFLVDNYYLIQEMRKRAGNQGKAMSKADEPHTILDSMYGDVTKLEGFLQSSLDVYSANHPVGDWMRSIKGIGPVLAAGLLAHIDIRECPSVGHIYSFAGLISGQKWEKGQRRPWNASLKTLCWKIGQSFVYFSGPNNPSPYGIRYRAWKELYIARNEAGLFAEKAKQTLEERNYRRDTEAYKAYIQGKFPPGRIDLMARRKAVKLFLSHLHNFWYEHEFKTEPPAPYVMVYANRVDYIPRPDQLDKDQWPRYFGQTPPVHAEDI